MWENFGLRSPEEFDSSFRKAIRTLEPNKNGELFLLGVFNSGSQEELIQCPSGPFIIKGEKKKELDVSNTGV